MRLKLLLLLLAVGFVVVAAQKTYVFLTNLHPTRMTCAEFVNGRSSAKWVVLTNCELDPDHAIALQSFILKVDKGLYVPVRPAGTTGPAPVLLKTDDSNPSAGITATRITTMPLPVAPERTLTTVVATVSGLVPSGLDTDRKARDALDKVARDGRIRTDYVVIDAGKKPDPGEAIMGASVLACVALVVFLLIRNRLRQARNPGPSAAAPTPPPIPPAARI